MTASRRHAIALFASTALPVRAAEAKVMYMVRRTYATDKDIAALRTPAEPEHQKHLLKFGETVISSAIIVDGKRIGSVSVSNSADRAEIERYVYDDPFTKAGIYGSIGITTVELFKLNGSYNRAPAWFAPELQRRQQAAGFNVPVMPTGNVGAKTMFAVRQTYSSDRNFDSVRARFGAARHQHILDGAMIVVAAVNLDDRGNRVGEFSIVDTEDRAAIDRYLADDPYTVNGAFVSTKVDRVDLYKLDGSYARAGAP